MSLGLELLLEGNLTLLPPVKPKVHSFARIRRYWQYDGSYLTSGKINRWFY